MCKYCEKAVPLVLKDNNSDYGIAIYHPDRLVAYGSDGVSCKINYCPMCGKSLKHDMLKKSSMQLANKMRIQNDQKIQKKACYY